MAEPVLTSEQQRRQAALDGMNAFANEHGCDDRNWREIDNGDHIGFIGTTKEGREFALGYKKDLV